MKDVLLVHNNTVYFIKRAVYHLVAGSKPVDDMTEDSYRAAHISQAGLTDYQVNDAQTAVGKTWACYA